VRSTVVEGPTEMRPSTSLRYARDDKGRASDRLDTMSTHPLEVRISHLEGAYEQLDKRLGDLAAATIAGFSQVDSRFAQVDSRFSQVDARLDSIDRKIDGLQWRMTSPIVVTWLTAMLAILFKH
jgi:hypothetical protein